MFLLDLLSELISGCLNINPKIKKTNLNYSIITKEDKDLGD